MTPVLLQLTSGYLSKILYLLALIFFLKGHNNPGGGFIAGLMVASAVMLNMLAHGTDKTRRSLFLRPTKLAVLGVILALISGLLPLLIDKAFFTGLWLPEFSLPLLGTMHLGTPLLFDLGVFMTVVGFTVSVIFDLENTE
ncbi:MAG: hypothetical protein NE327_02845 [Lentisphaeraceae bacterium]|nr:hypothetical protein [Lentisphaeraceae bacterium]